MSTIYARSRPKSPVCRLQAMWSAQSNLKTSGS